MKIIREDMYLDGGTLLLITDIDIFYLDRRIRSKTKNMIYVGCPFEEAVPLSKKDSIYEEVLSAFKQSRYYHE